MPSFILDANILLYKKRLQQATDPKKIEMIQTLLADAETKLGRQGNGRLSLRRMCFERWALASFESSGCRNIGIRAEESLPGLDPHIPRGSITILRPPSAARSSLKASTETWRGSEAHHPMDAFCRT